jgi:hypothetical protein
MSGRLWYSERRIGGRRRRRKGRSGKWGWGERMTVKQRRKERGGLSVMMRVTAAVMRRWERGGRRKAVTERRGGELREGTLSYERRIALMKKSVCGIRPVETVVAV